MSAQVHQPYPHSLPGTERPPLGFLDFVLPPSGALLFGLFVIVLPLWLLTGESLILPIIEASRVFINNPESQVVSKGVFLGLPLHFYLKAGIFLLLSFLGVMQVFWRIKATYYTVWSFAFGRVHSLHPAYHPDPQLSAITLMNWGLYRFISLWAVPLLLVTITALIGFGELYFLNAFPNAPVFTLPLQYILALFFFSLFALISFFSVLNTLWASITTVFGDVIAVTEPELPPKTIFDRASRLSFSSSWVVPFLLLQALFWIGAGVALYLLFSRYDIEDVVTFNADMLGLFAASTLSVALYIMLNYLRFFTYHHALTRFYAKLPPRLKQRFLSQMPATGPNTNANNTELY